MNLNIESIPLTEGQRQAARDAIQLLAYRKWKEAGCPECHPLKFWREAELEWIEYEYPPNRPFEAQALPTSSSKLTPSSIDTLHPAAT